MSATSETPEDRRDCSEDDAARSASTMRIGIVGAGPMGRLHARTVSTLAADEPGSVLVSVVDRHAGRAESVATEFGCDASTDLEAACRDLDAVVVCVPTGVHFATTKLLLEAGCDVLVEKPLAMNVAEGEALGALACSLERILQVGHVEWYNRGWRDAVELVGVPEMIEVERLCLASDRGLELDVVQDLMLHDLDWVTRWLADEIVDLTGQGRCVLHDKLDEAEVELTFRSGCRVRLRASRVDKKQSRTVRITGREGFATGDLRRQCLTDATAGLVSSTGGIVPTSEHKPPDALTMQWRDFLRSVRERENPLADAMVGVAALQIVEDVQNAIAKDGSISKKPRSSKRENGSALSG